jgi:hypothetical protein
VVQEDDVTVSRLRISAASGLLAFGALVAVGSVAHADSGSAASHGAGGSSAADPGRTKPSAPSSHVNDAVRSTLHGAATTLGWGQHQPTQAPSAKLPSTIAAATRVTRTVTGSIGARQQPTAPAAAATLTLVEGLVEPVTDVVATTLPTLATPLAIVAPLAQLPSHVAPLLGIGSTQLTDPSAVAGAPASAGGDAVALLLEIIQHPSAPLGTTGAPTPPPLTASPFDLTAALGHTRSASSNARAAAAAAGPGGVQAFLESYGGLVIAAAAVAASLAALVAAAFPGLAGMFLPAAAGAHIGYRQAKARTAMRTSGTARFSAVGPIGIVRSGALVTLRPNSSHVARAGTLSQNVA